ncbi:MAG TPA: M3 family peptidase, partial [Asticcacaulis sp.]
MNRSRRFYLGAAAFAALAAGAPRAVLAAAPDMADNPFAQPSALPLQAPPFDRIKDTDYQPAIEEGMRQQLAEIDAIANDPAPPTFENTL